MKDTFITNRVGTLIMELTFVFIDKEYRDCYLTNIKHYKEFKTKDYVDALNLGIKLANKGISKVCLDKKKER